MPKCDYPLTIKLDQPKVTDGGLIYTIPVNCGKCLNCLRRRTSQWSFRIMEQLKISENAKFVTLTYDTANIPLSEKGLMTLRKTDLQDFFKRLRYEQIENKNITYEEYERLRRKMKVEKLKAIRYYAVGEYGTKRNRPHYHIILFNCRNDEIISKAWGKGGIHVMPANINTIDYVLKYLMKPASSKRKQWFDGEKEFSLMSKRLGEDWIHENKLVSFYNRNLELNYVVNDRMVKVAMPRYYRDIIFMCQKPEPCIITRPKKIKGTEIIYNRHELAFKRCKVCKTCKNKDKQIGIIKTKMEEEEMELKAKVERSGLSYDDFITWQKKGRQNLKNKGQDRPKD